MNIKYPNVEVDLARVDGNVFSIIGTVEKAIRQKVGDDEADLFHDDVMWQESYDKVLQLVMGTVNVSYRGDMLNDDFC